MLRQAPAAERNKEPILNVLKQYIAGSRRVLEVSSGTGQHTAHFAAHFPDCQFLPTEFDRGCFESIQAHIDEHRLSNVHRPVFIDVSQPVDQWNLPPPFDKSLDVILNINMIHISSNAAVDGLFKAAGVLLKPATGLLITYGPYSVDGLLSPESNVRFDQSLRQQNPEWGVRDTSLIKQKAADNRLIFIAMHDMPANNKTLVFRRTDQ